MIKKTSLCAPTRGLCYVAKTLTSKQKVIASKAKQSSTAACKLTTSPWSANAHLYVSGSF